jgi:limonene-1,2-epoxide hydrolase
MPTGDIAPSNRRISLKAAQVFEIEGERIREAHHYFDLTSLLQQIGAAG